MKGHLIKILFWEHSSLCEEDVCINERHISLNDGIIVMFALDNRISFEKALKWIENIKMAKVKLSTIILVGNKSDKVKKRKITHDEALNKGNFNLAIFYEVMYLEISVKKNFNLNQLVLLTMINILHSYKANSKIRGTNKLKLLPLNKNRKSLRRKKEGCF